MELQTVNYLMSGSAHLPYLVTSLWTLKDNITPDTQATVHAWPESYELVKTICSDSRFEFVDCRKSFPDYRGKNDQFLAKIRLMQGLGTYPNLYLDADTLVVKPINHLFEVAKDYGFVATQFNDWTCGSRLIRKRIAWLREIPEIDQNLIDRVIEGGDLYDSVNGGVFASCPDSTVLTLWYHWAWAARSIFIADECVLHLMQAKFGDMEFDGCVVADGRFNSSPKFTAKDDSGSVRIWHGHGDCFARPAKSREGHALWWPVFQECLRENVGQIKKWVDTCGNRHLSKLRKVA